MSKIRAIIKRPDEKYGHVANISNTLENFQRTVEGYIETFGLDSHGNIIICNEEGKLKRLAPNFKIETDTFFDIFVGTVVIVGTKGEKFSDVRMTLDEWKRQLEEWGN